MRIDIPDESDLPDHRELFFTLQGNSDHERVLLLIREMQHPRVIR